MASSLYIGPCGYMRLGLLRKHAQAADTPALGIPDMAVYGDVLGTLKPGDITDFVLQRHDTVRNPKNPHYDMRLGTRDTNLFSWAVPGAVLPPPGQMKAPLPQTQLHTYQYGSFAGKIRHGYGAGTVSMADKGQAIITRVTPNTLHFTLGHKKVPTRYVLIHTGGKTGKMWQLYAKPNASNVPGVGDKPVYKQIQAQDRDDAIAQAQELQEKIDGAHGIINVGPKGEVDAYSIRRSVGGTPISHTERMQMWGLRVPTRFKGQSYRGEMYFTDAKDRAVPFKDVSGLLNMLPARSIEAQRQRGLRPRIALFDQVSPAPRTERQQAIQELIQNLPSELFHTPARARTQSEKEQLFRTIAQGKNPRTSEGVMAVMPDDSVAKIKNKEEATGYVTGTFPGSGKRQGTAGGLTFVTERDQKGGPESKVGTGFTDRELQDIVARIEELKGQPIRIEHMGRFSSGKLRAPSFKGFETDKVAAMVKDAIIRRRGKNYTLFSRSGKVLGIHRSREAAKRQERAIKARKHAQARPQFIQQAIFGGNRELLRRAGSVKTPAKRLAAQIRAYYQTLPKQLVQEHIQHPDLQHVLSWEDKLGAASEPSEVRLRFLGKDGIVKASALVEVADTPALRRQGLTGREALADGRGMFFDKSGTYWMKGLEFPLDIVFVDGDGRILEKQSMDVEPEPDQPQCYYTGPGGSAHAIELPAGWCDRHGIGVGDKVTV